MKPSRYLILALLALIVSLALHKIYDPDFWWQLAAGDRMRETHTILRVNAFSFTHPQHEWLNVYWLYQLALSWFWLWGGATGITVFRLLLVLMLAALVLFGLRERRQLPCAGETAVVMLAWLLLTPRLTDRPELASFVLLAAMLALVRQRRWWWCVPLQLIWANVHRFFCWGPVILALAVVCEWVAGNRRAARSAMLAAGVAVVVSSLSPFGWRNWLILPMLGATMHAVGGDVEELVSPFHPVAWAGDGTGWLLIAFLLLAVALFAVNRKAVRLFDWLIMIATLPLALTVRRGIPLFVICMMPALLAATPRLEKRALCLAVTGLCLAFAVGLRVHGREFGVGAAESDYPHRAVEFIQRHVHEPLRLFNAGFSTGGYLIAHRLPVFMDGRFEAYPAEFVREYFRSTEDASTFRKMARDYAVSHVLVATTTTEMRAFAQRVASVPEWNTLYTDDVAVVLERKP